MQEKVLKYYMWGYQQHFLSSLEINAKRIINRIAPNLDFHTFLLGILVDKRDDREPICIEPEICEIDINIFKNLKNEAELLFENEKHGVFHTLKLAQDNFEHRLYKRCFRDTIKQRLSTSKGKISFVSWPIKVGGYLVCSVFQFDEEQFNQYNSLKKSNDNKNIPDLSSFLHSVIEKILQLASSALYLPDPGAGLDILDRPDDEVLRDAARQFLYIPSFRAASLSQGLRGLYNFCNNISLLRHEGEIASGNIVVARQNHPDIDQLVSFENKIPLYDFKQVRKLLNLCNSDASLLTDTDTIYGLGRIKDSYDTKNEDIFIISFEGEFKWSIKNHEIVMMNVRYGIPSIPLQSIDELWFRSNLKRVLDVQDLDVDKIWKITNAAIKAKNGGLIVISENAPQEANRLKSQSTIIKPVINSEDLIVSFTSIDGAVLLDPGGTCFAIGVILDGNAVEFGSPSRGSRYNSAIRYVFSRDHSVLAVVISKDGSIDIIPSLSPQISRKEIDGKMKILEDQDKLDVPEVKDVHTALTWLNDHRFYISKNVCDKINVLKESLSKKIIDADHIAIVYRNFAPYPDMNDKYFLD